MASTRLKQKTPGVPAGAVGCRIQDPGTRDYRWCKTADFSHSARCAPTDYTRVNVYVHSVYKLCTVCTDYMYTRICMGIYVTYTSRIHIRVYVYVYTYTRKHVYAYTRVYTHIWNNGIARGGGGASKKQEKIQNHRRQGRKKIGLQGGDSMEAHFPNPPPPWSPCRDDF